MDNSMSAADVPSGMSQFSSSMPSIDELLRRYEARSGWKLISMPNLTALCHEHKCDKCSTYLEHLLIANQAGELCTRPEGLEAWLDHVWPATMNDIRRDVSEPLAKKLDITCDLCDIKDNEIDCDQQMINNLHDKLDKERWLQCRLKEWLAQDKGKQKEESEVTMGSPLPHKCQAVGVLQTNPLTHRHLHIPTLLQSYLCLHPPLQCHQIHPGCHTITHVTSHLTCHST